jgi:hypothetical protein
LTALVLDGVHTIGGPWLTMERAAAQKGTAECEGKGEV